MSQVTIVDNDYITVEYLTEDGIIRHTIHQPVSGEPFRDAINAGTAALAEYGAIKWLSDDRKNGPLSAEDAEWGFEDWNRRAVSLGWKYWAMVVPESMIAADSLTFTVQELAELGLRVMTFTDPDEAMAWLVGQPS